MTKKHTHTHERQNENIRYARIISHTNGIFLFKIYYHTWSINMEYKTLEKTCSCRLPHDTQTVYK